MAIQLIATLLFSIGLAFLFPFPTVDSNEVGHAGNGPVGRSRVLPFLKDTLNFSTIISNIDSVPGSTRESLQKFGELITLSARELSTSVELLSTANSFMKDSIYLMHNMSDLFVRNIEKLSTLSKEIGKPLEKLYPLVESQIELGATITKSITGILQDIQTIRTTLTNLVTRISVLYFICVLSVFLLIVCILLVVLIVRLNRQVQTLLTISNNQSDSGNAIINYNYGKDSLGMSRIVEQKRISNTTKHISKENLIDNDNDQIIENDDLL